MILSYFLAFLCGALTKFTDNVADEKLKTKPGMLHYFTGAGYGLIAGFLAVSSAEFATVVLAITIGVLVTGKIDSRQHILALAVLFAVVAFVGLPAISLGLLAAFAFFAFLDESLNDWVDRAREKSIAIRWLGIRPFLGAATLAFGFVSGNFVFFLGLFCFDAAYNIADKATPFMLKRAWLKAEQASLRKKGSVA